MEIDLRFRPLLKVAQCWCRLKGFELTELLVEVALGPAAVAAGLPTQ